MKYSNLQHSILVTLNLVTCSLNSVMSCCVPSLLSLCEAHSSVSVPPYVVLGESEDLQFYSCGDGPLLLLYLAMIPL